MTAEGSAHAPWRLLYEHGLGVGVRGGDRLGMVWVAAAQTRHGHQMRRHGRAHCNEAGCGRREIGEAACIEALLAAVGARSVDGEAMCTPRPLHCAWVLGPGAPWDLAEQRLQRRRDAPLATAPGKPPPRAPVPPACSSAAASSCSGWSGVMGFLFFVFEYKIIDSPLLSSFYNKVNNIQLDTILITVKLLFFLASAEPVT